MTEALEKRLFGKMIKDQGILPEGYKAGWNDCISEFCHDFIREQIAEQRKESAEAIIEDIKVYTMVDKPMIDALKAIEIVNRHLSQKG